MSFIDVAVGISGRGVLAAGGVARRVRPVLKPAVQSALRPPLLPEKLQPARWLATVADEGAERRAVLTRAASTWFDVLVPVLLDEVLRRAGLTELVQRYVDVDELVAGVDLDAAAARLDVEAVVHRVDLDDLIGRVDVDTIVDRVDVGSVVNRVDVDSVVERVDVEAVVNRVDLDAAARRLDLERVLDRIDLTGLVLQRVDLDVLVQAVLDRIDLIKLAEEVIDGVDLPEIIRESTGSMASDTVSGARMQGIVADEAVGRAVDRLLLRRGRRSTQAPGAASLPPEQDQPAALPAQRGPRR